MPVTIREVAKYLNLSITTVSRALDGYDDVSEETKKRVILAAREMGYVPSQAARQLRRKRTEMIGYILPTNTPSFSDPFFSQFIAGLGDGAVSHHYDLLVSIAPPDQEEERTTYQGWVRSRRVDGMVLGRMRSDDWRVRFLHEAQFPFVTFGRTSLPIDFPHIGVDGENGIRRLMTHLIERGHRRIAFVSAPPHLTLQGDRFKGYLRGLEESGIRFDETLVAQGDLTRESGYLAGGRLLDLPDRPTAIIGVNDLTAIGVMRAAHERGLVIGRDLAVAGFDGVEEGENVQPPLTTLKQSVYDIAVRLIHMLIHVINGETLIERTPLVQPELIIRASTGG